MTKRNRLDSATRRDRAEQLADGGTPEEVNNAAATAALVAYRAAMMTEEDDGDE